MPAAATVVVLLLGAFARPGTAQEPPADPAARLMGWLEALASDDMRGRMTGTDDAARAARWIAARLAEAGVAPAGDDGYFQTIPALRRRDARGRTRIEPRPADAPAGEGEAVAERNVVGVVEGADPELADEVIVVGAHYDHVGVRAPVEGDSIYNGADDDASGVVAVLEAARALAAGPPPRRTVVFALFTGEEVGGLGSGWYLDHPVRPLERTVAQLQVEMIGRPDPAAGGAGRVWATGYERSTMGDLLAARGIPVVADPRPDQRFFFRSDNIRFALAGIPAHTLSSFNLHGDYHRPSDEVERVDADHFVRAVQVVVDAVRVLADADETPAWKPGGRPQARRGGREGAP